jgi:iron complex transport system substrate-binding protein
MRFLYALIILILSISTAQAGIPGDADGNDKLSLEELSDAVLSCMLEGHPELNDLRDAAHVYTYWNGEPRSIVDSSGKKITIYRPIKSMVVLNSNLLEAIAVLNASEKVTGVAETITKYSRFFPEFSRLPSVGKWSEPDMEAILKLNPDAVCAYTAWPEPAGLEDKLPAALNVIRLDFYKAEALKAEMQKLGYLLEKEENAEKYLEWHERYVEAIKEKVSGISEENKTRVFIDAGGGKTFGRSAYSTGTGMNDLCVMAGGINIAEDHVKGYADVETEWILKEDPDIIVGISYKGGYETDNETLMKAHFDEILKLPGFDNVTAVKNSRVYIISNSFAFAPHYPAALATMAKWLYPDIFKDIDPGAIHQEYIDRFQRIDYNVSRQGVFVYPDVKE